MIEYKDYEIDTISYPGIITVFFEGDEIVFHSIEDAKQFIDSITA
jgi:predicted transcriptional regulator YheO